MAMTNQTHFRSISLPSRLQQVNPTNFKSEFEKIKNCCPTSESIQSGLLGLAELYNSVEEFTLKSKASHQDSKTSMEESLSQSVDLLDACTAIKELLQMMRENIHSLQSALRRKGTDAAVQNDVASYFSFRKKMQKTVVKTLKKLKKSESSIIKNSVNSVNSESDTGFLFRQLAAITIANFKSVLEFVSHHAAARGGAWAVVSKLMVKESCAVKSVSEVESMDLGVGSLQGKNGARVCDVQRRLQVVDDVIEEFEGGLERLFRQLVQTRVTLLNILTDH